MLEKLNVSNTNIYNNSHTYLLYIYYLNEQKTIQYIQHIIIIRLYSK